MNAMDKHVEICQRVGPDVKVFLVEGVDDKMAFQTLLDRSLPGWEGRWAIEVGGSKSQVLKLLEKAPDWLGLVDRDEWDEVTVDQHAEKYPNLVVLPRFCLENYLIDPAELWPTIPSVRQTDIPGGQREFEAALQRDLPRFVRHGVLWRTVQPLWGMLRRGGKFPTSLASKDSVEIAQNDEEIFDILKQWHEMLNPDDIWNRFQDGLDKVKALPIPQQLHSWVHGKYYWPVINAEMNELFGQMEERQRRTKILRKLSWPRDIGFLLQRLK